MSKSRKKRKPPKCVLALPDLEQAKSAVLNTLTSKSGQRTYDHAITEFVEWYCSEPRSAVRRIAYEAADSDLLSSELAAGIRRVKGVRRLGMRVGNWLTAEQGKRLLNATSADTLRSKRNRAMLSLLIGCGLRRAELLGLMVNSIQLREEHWVIADLVGKGGHIRTVPIPLWVKRSVDSWTESAHITTGRVFRAINKAGRIWGDGMTPKVLWEVVKDAAARSGIEKLAPHDLRRTCARLCHLAGGELDQIRFLLGHVSIQTTERYLGCKQKLRIAVNDNIGLEPAQASNVVISCNAQLLLAAEISFSRLYGHVQTTERYLGCKQKLRIAVNDNIGLEPAHAS